MKKYRTSRYRFSIEEIDVRSETTQFVVLDTGRREKKSSDYGSILDTREEAENWVLNHHRQAVDAAARNLAMRQKDLNHAISLYGPRNKQ